MKHYRCERVADQIIRTISQLIRNKASDPRLAALTITGAKVTKDLKVAFVYYSYQKSSVTAEEIEQAIEKASGYIRREMGIALKMRFVPELRFEFDESLEHGNKIWDKLAALCDEESSAPTEEEREQE